MVAFKRRGGGMPGNRLPRAVKFVLTNAALGSLIGGMVGATTLALFFVPLFYVLISQLSERFSPSKAPAGSPSAVPAPSGNTAPADTGGQ